MDQWAYSNSVKIELSRLGKPTDNAVVESFNGRFREECLNTHWFESLDDARAKIDAWRWDYNEHRPHRSLEGLTPREFARRAMLQGGRGLTVQMIQKYRALQEPSSQSFSWASKRMAGHGAARR
jgi:putative transposase